MTVRFGLALDFNSDTRSLDQNFARHLRLCRLAESYGFDSVWAGESYPSAPGSAHLPAPFLMLAGMATNTKLKIGTGVILMLAHNPLRLAYETAELDQLSGGRLVLGAGAGHPRLAPRFGVEPVELSEYIDEQLQALRALWGGSDGFQGKRLNLQGKITPVPYQDGGPPIWVGGGIRRSAERAARFGDAFIASTSHIFPRLLRLIDAYRTSLAALGKDPTKATIAANRLMACAESEAEAQEIGRTGLSGVMVRYAASGSFGPDRQAAAAPADVIYGELEPEMALVGTPDQVAAKVQQYVDAGITNFQCRVCPEEMPEEVAAQTIRLMGEKVLPRFA